MFNSGWIVYAVGGFFSAVALVVGLLALNKAVREQRKTRSAGGWASATGTLYESRVEELFEDPGDGPRTFKTVIRYGYQVGGVEYEGKHLMVGDDPLGSKAAMEKILAHYPQGKQVLVYYNPLQPADSVLEKQSKSSTKALILGIAFLLVGICIACYTAGSVFIQQ